jgi:alkylhydroperoxidase/carboxymuconolactone decarboxylase family protein YurZ
MRLGLSEVGVTELLAVVEHTHSLGRLVGALLIEPDLSKEIPPEHATLIGLPTGDELSEATRAILAEIRAVEGELVGVDRVPNLWRAIARDHHYLAATWAKNQTVMAAGELTEQQKRIVALGVAMNAGCRYLIERLNRALRRTGFRPTEVLEIAAVVDHYNSLNKVTDGMQVPSDILAPGTESERE